MVFWNRLKRGNYFQLNFGIINVILSHIVKCDKSHKGQ